MTSAISSNPIPNSNPAQAPIAVIAESESASKTSLSALSIYTTGYTILPSLVLGVSWVASQAFSNFYKSPSLQNYYNSNVKSFGKIVSGGAIAWLIPYIKQRADFAIAQGHTWGQFMTGDLFEKFRHLPWNAILQVGSDQFQQIQQIAAPTTGETDSAADATKPSNDEAAKAPTTAVAEEKAAVDPNSAPDSTPAEAS